MSSNQSNILFYMESCKTCNVFINLAHKNDILKHFKLICIDGQVEQFVSKGLKKVPTIIVKNINKQIDGNECLKWLDSIIKMKSNNSINNSVNNQNDIFINEMGLTSQSTPIFITQPKNNNVLKRNNLINEPPIINNSNIKNNNINNNLNNLNNSNQPSVKPINQLYGYLENEMSGFSDSYAYLLVDNPLPKSFLPPDKDLQIYTAPEGNKLDKKTQDYFIKNMEIIREKDKDEFINNITLEHNNLKNSKNINISNKWISEK